MIRDLTSLDRRRLEFMHRQSGFQYELPDVDSPELLVKVGYDYNGRMVQAILARRTIELYMLADREFETPAHRQEVLRLLHDSVEKRLSAMGIEDVFVWLPPQVEDTFGKRLVKNFGWVPVPWLAMTHFVKAGG